MKEEEATQYLKGIVEAVKFLKENGTTTEADISMLNAIEIILNKVEKLESQIIKDKIK